MIGLLVLAGIMVVLVVLAALRNGTSFVIDIVERALATYVETLLGLLLAGTALDHFSSGVYSMSDLNVVLLATVPTGLAIIKGAVASFVGQKGTAAALPSAAVPAVEVPSVVSAETAGEAKL